jgi:hypothetical protein
MSDKECTSLRIVLRRPNEGSSDATTYNVQIPRGAGIDDLLLRLQKESPEIYEEVRERILSSARRILAFGSGDELMASFHRGLAEGGTIVLSTDDDLGASFHPLNETETQH